MHGLQKPIHDRGAEILDRYAWSGVLSMQVISPAEYRHGSCFRSVPSFGPTEIAKRLKIGRASIYRALENDQ